MMQDTTIAFIGGGNMARSLIGGLIAGGCPPEQIWAADPQKDTLDSLEESFGIHVTPDNAAATAAADVIVLAVKPQIMGDVLFSIVDAVRSNKPMIISIAAGITEALINNGLGGGAAIVRTMPNTPALLRCGATALFANDAVSEAQREKAESILRSVGIVRWVEDEKQLDAITAVSGSGPAYFFLLIEQLQKAGEELGLPHETAHLMALQTAYGAARMALESTEDPGVLRERVTSPGGTTAAALNHLAEHDFADIFRNAVRAACERSAELSREIEASEKDA
ncbi:MAG: pyrroline-5-carboxylate reductase [Gammaproteobacteria bacterium]|nr:pyrroline-5-carboxylate reductase [Gammaproteobacteria bacterium]